MKLLECNGKRMQVWELSGPVYRVRPNANIPVPYHGYHIMDDDSARDLLRTLLDEDCFTGERCD